MLPLKTRQGNKQEALVVVAAGKVRLRVKLRRNWGGSGGRERDTYFKGESGAGPERGAGVGYVDSLSTRLSRVQMCRC